jgi:hypothetical protein
VWPFTLQEGQTWSVLGSTPAAAAAALVLAAAAVAAPPLALPRRGMFTPRTSRAKILCKKAPVVLCLCVYVRACVCVCVCVCVCECVRTYQLASVYHSSTYTCTMVVLYTCRLRNVCVSPRNMINATTRP